jgi:hypothetical protein
MDFLTKKVQTLTERLNMAELLLVKRDDQITILKKVHDKRWLRLKHLQKQYRTLKDELESYKNQQEAQSWNVSNRFSLLNNRQRRSGCSVCLNQHWRQQTGNKRKLLKQEDDDSIWNEVTKLRRENTRFTDEK